MHTLRPDGTVGVVPLDEWRAAVAPAAVLWGGDVVDRGGPGVRSWATKPRNRALMGKVSAAHFSHFTLSPGSVGLSYQSCRFCLTAGRDNEDAGHGAQCWYLKHEDACRGLWRYAIRHYVCTRCRGDILAGLAPQRRR